MREDNVPAVDEPDPVLLRLLLEFSETLLECGESIRMREGEALPCDGVFIPCDMRTAEAVQDGLADRRRLAEEHNRRMEQMRRLREMAAMVAVPRLSTLSPARPRAS